VILKERERERERERKRKGRRRFEDQREVRKFTGNLIRFLTTQRASRKERFSSSRMVTPPPHKITETLLHSTITVDFVMVDCTEEESN
jgi:hypothetical protein